MNAPTNTKRETSTVDGTPGSFSAASRLPRGVLAGEGSGLKSSRMTRAASRAAPAIRRRRAPGTRTCPLSGCRFGRR